jgi:LPXTG-site transpeptidase (sortase) family protein
MNSVPQPTKAVPSTRAYILRSAFYFFLCFGTLALGYAGFVFADSHRYQALEKKKFEQHGRLSEPHLLVEGEVIGEIQVPRLGLSAVVVQGDSTASLRHAVGHMAKSALPGEWGNVALAGHRDTYFRPLRDIQVGDEIRFKTLKQSLEYAVESIEVVTPADVHVLEAVSGHDLTFITCFPFYFVGPAPKRFVVRAREVAKIPREQLARDRGRGGNDRAAVPQ